MYQLLDYTNNRYIFDTNCTTFDQQDQILILLLAPLINRQTNQTKKCQHEKTTTSKGFNDLN